MRTDISSQWLISQRAADGKIWRLQFLRRRCIFFLHFSCIFLIFIAFCFISFYSILFLVHFILFHFSCVQDAFYLSIGDVLEKGNTIWSNMQQLSFMQNFLNPAMFVISYLMLPPRQIKLSQIEFSQIKLSQIKFYQITFDQITFSQIKLSQPSDVCHFLFDVATVSDKTFSDKIFSGNIFSDKTFPTQQCLSFLIWCCHVSSSRTKCDPGFSNQMDNIFSLMEALHWNIVFQGYIYMSYKIFVDNITLYTWMEALSWHKVCGGSILR